MNATAYTTAHEIAFVLDLGHHAPPHLRGRHRMLDLLVGYRAGAARRTDWGHINKDAVMTQLNLLIGREESRESRRRK